MKSGVIKGEWMDGGMNKSGDCREGWLSKDIGKWNGREGDCGTNGGR